MKAEFTPTGEIIISALNDTEAYALETFIEKNVNKCEMQAAARKIFYDTYSYTDKKDKIPPPPPPPLCRVINETGINNWGICPNCHSTVMRKNLFGRKYCINPDCKNHSGL